MESFAKLIDSMGVPEIARIIGTSESHVRVMKTRDSIPALYWHLIVQEAKHSKSKRMRDLTPRKLYAMRKRRFRSLEARAS